MNTKKKYLTIPRLFKSILLILAIISLFFYIKPYVSAKYLPSDAFKSVEYQSLGLLNKEQVKLFNSKTPRSLFVNYYYKSLALWLGFHNYYFELLNSISPNIININDYSENTKNLKIDEILVALIQTDFTWDDLPTNIDSDKISIILGKDNKQTFYLAKNPMVTGILQSKTFKILRLIKSLNNSCKRKNYLLMIFIVHRCLFYLI